MRIKFYLQLSLTTFFLMSLTSCKDSIKRKGQQVLNKEDSATVSKNQEDCIFDQETQNDEFLKGINELKEYVWDSDSKSGKLSLDDGTELIIVRGGCDHFELSVTFKRRGIFEFKENKNFFFEKIIWITSLLDEFEGELIKEAIENKKISITEENQTNLYINFMNENLYESYFMNYNMENENTKFSISYNFN